MENKCWICGVETKVLNMDGYGGPVKCNNCLDIRLKSFYQNQVYDKILNHLKYHKKLYLQEKPDKNISYSPLIILNDLIGEIEEMKNENS